jgi:hypothetical protein
MGDLDRLSRMMPVDEPVVPPTDPWSRRSWRTIRAVMVLAGVVMMLVCGWILFIILGQALLLVDPELSGSAYWSEVSSRLFGPRFWRWLISPPCWGFVLGIVLVVLGLLRPGRLEG